MTTFEYGNNFREFRVEKVREVRVEKVRKLTVEKVNVSAMSFYWMVLSCHEHAILFF